MPLNAKVDFMVMFLVNPTYALQQTGGDEGEDVVSLGFNSELNFLTLFIYDLPAGTIDEDTVNGSIRLNGEVVAEGNFSWGYFESEQGRNYYYFSINNVENVNDDTTVGWNGVQDTEGNQILPEYSNGITFGDWEFNKNKKNNNNNNNDAGGPTIDKDNLCPFYGLFYAMVMVGRFGEHGDAVDMTKPYAVFGKVIQKLKRL
jgi:hypothetical protein